MTANVQSSVANAAATAFRPMLEQKVHNLRKTFAISVESFVAVVQAATPLMKEGGRIVVISGIDSHQAMTGHGVLGAAKAADRAGNKTKARAYAIQLQEIAKNAETARPELEWARVYLGSK